MPLRPGMTAERFRNHGDGHLPALLGMRVVALEEGMIEMELTVREEVLAPNGFLHAATVVGLADTAAGYGCIAHLPEAADRRAAAPRARALAAQALIAALACLSPAVAGAAGALENPQPGGHESGVGIVSGWHCGASRIEIEFDGNTTYLAAHGTARADTQATCGRSDTGFSLLINWNTLGAGAHVVRALADGVEFGRASAIVVPIGSEFWVGKGGTMRLDNFPQAGKGVIAEWQESKQNFVIRESLQSVPSVNGSWFGPVLEQWHGCNNPAYNGNHGANATWSVSMYDGVNLSINGNVQTSPAFSCSYTGTHALDGAQHAAAGTFTCTNGKQGNWRTTDFQVTERGLSLTGEGNWTQQGVACQMKFLLGGYRHLPLP